MLTADQVRHISRLARLQLTETEVAKFTQDLSAVLDYVEKLKELDTSDVGETNQVTNLNNHSRPDEIQPFVATDALLDNSGYPKTGREIKVRKSI